MLWKYRKNTDGNICNFSIRDKENSYPHLLNTLFLLTPVMSTTFASAGRFLRNIKEPGQLGFLIVDEAGQASPHMALGALWRCRKAIIVGDPKQVEPVVTDDMDIIKKAFTNDILAPYISKTISVQECAVKINMYGATITDSFTDQQTWVGCPLVIHRRCIEPMFTISNNISYGGTMKMQTAKAKIEDETKFVMEKSCWMHISGKEYGRKNHFVQEQGEAALNLIIKSFQNYNGIPDLYVISPFTTVINGFTELVNRADLLKPYGIAVRQWTFACCGTVHKFQGKEAKEVILLLGCDSTSGGAVRWVKPNILNVAATRAKYRLYIIGDYQVWKQSQIFKIAKEIIDSTEKG